MKTDYTVEILKELPIPTKQRDVFVTYLCTDSGVYPTFQQVGEQFEMSKQRAHQIVDKIVSYLKLRFAENGSLEALYCPIQLILDKYKGAISISSYLDFTKKEWGLDELSSRRQLHFAMLVSNLVHITPKLDLFWEHKSACIKCGKYAHEFGNFDEDDDELLAEIDKFCKSTNCRHCKGRSFDPGQLSTQRYYHTSNQFESSEACEESEQAKIEAANIARIRLLYKQMYRPTNKTKSELANIAKIEAAEHIPKIKAEGFTSNQMLLLDFFISNGARVPKIKLDAYCRVKRIDLNSEINTINSQFYTKHNTDLLTYQNLDENWELSDTALPFIIEPEGNTSKADVSDSEPLVSATIKLHEKMLTNTLSNVKQSYKFYWALALLHCIEKDMLSVDKRYLASLMCTFAWNDVLIHKLHYSHKDHIPITVQRIYRNSCIQKTASFNEALREIQQFIDEDDILTLVRTVAVYFNETYLITSEDAGYNDKYYESSTKKPFYTLDQGMILFNPNETNVIKTNASRLTAVVTTQKDMYFERINTNEDN